MINISQLKWLPHPHAGLEIERSADRNEKKPWSWRGFGLAPSPSLEKTTLSDKIEDGRPGHSFDG
jgi:hypothetical protein